MVIPTLPSIGLASSVLRALGVLLALGAAACSDGNSSPSDDSSAAIFAGTWLGSITVGATELHVVFQLESNPNGTYSATMDSPDQGAFDIPVTTVVVEEREVTLTIASLDLEFAGELSDDGQAISGIVTQSGMSVPLSVRKQSGPLDHSRPQDPKAPYPYDSADVEVMNDDAGVRLACTLTWPKGEGPFDSVALITGSGPQNRDEELANHRPFRVLADALARDEIAALRCDDRGFGESSGDFASATSLDFVSDAKAQVAFLATQDRFAVSRIGLIGHSEGGALAPLAADANPAVDYLVLLAGPGVSGEQILISQQRAISAAQGTSERQLDAEEKLERKALALVREIADPDELESRLRELLRDNGVTGDALEANVASLTTPWMRFFVSYDPAPVLRRTTLPVLALNGELDLQVLPELNLPAIASALEDAGNADAVTRELPGLNHLFQHATTGLPDEYLMIDETLAPEVLRAIPDWIHALITP